ncbi:leucine efflux protein LeuE [Aeromonas salmonicida]|uniref:leucine efflux protein LeuE n=1 Tax=Aeromonas salmonicida TaxID=645 RepID=UPI00232DD184|nr:leucine efflux protein LeuE [Aeromonas salmonicida]WCH27336.1 leucine efflux protein LeuE [Aeromonas salmonicida]
MFESLGVVNVWTYLVGLFFIIIAPGPNSLYVLRTGASRGVGPGYRAALGVFVGDAILIFCAYLGVASLIRTTPLLFTLVRYLGAIYLLYLGVKILHANFVAKREGQESVVDPGERYFSKALTLSITNPKAILFYVSFFVQFIDFNYAHTWLSYLVLAGMLEAMSFVYLTLLIFGGTLVASFFRQRQTAARLGNGLIGLFFVGFAARLATISS